MKVREYAYASDDLLLLIKVMDMLGIHALSIADTARFYGMLGICSFYTYVNHLDYVEDEDKYHYWLDTLFMKYLLEAMMAMAEEKFDERKI